jgi:hypothetical protein
MTSDDPRSIQLRIAKLQERLSEKPKRRFDFLKDSSKAISISAFVISVVTTVYSWRKEDMQAHEAARRQFDTTMQQLVDRGLTEFEFTAKNRNQPNFGVIAGWFNAQSGLMANRVVQDLAAIDSASMFDYIMVGSTLLKTAQFSRAETLFDRAIKIGLQKKTEHDQIHYKMLRFIQTKLSGEKLDLSLTEEQRTHDLGSAYVSLGESLIGQAKFVDAEKAFGAAIQLLAESNQSDAAKGIGISFIHKTWAEAMASQDCKSAQSHLQTAASYLPDAKKIVEDVDWQSIQYELSWGSTHCGSDGKLHGDGPTTIRPDAQATTPTSVWPLPNGAQAGLPSGNDGKLQREEAAANLPNVKDAQSAAPPSLRPDAIGAGTSLPISHPLARRR